MEEFDVKMNMYDIIILGSTTKGVKCKALLTLDIRSLVQERIIIIINREHLYSAFPHIRAQSALTLILPD